MRLVATAAEAEAEAEAEAAGVTADLGLVPTEAVVNVRLSEVDEPA